MSRPAQIGTKVVVIEGKEYAVKVYAPASEERERMAAHARAGERRRYAGDGAEQRAEERAAARYLGVRA
jgi:hypothetical protein